MKEGEMGIIFGERKFPETGHVFNVINKMENYIFQMSKPEKMQI